MYKTYMFNTKTGTGEFLDGGDYETKSELVGGWEWEQRTHNELLNIVNSYELNEKTRSQFNGTLTTISNLYDITYERIEEHDLNKLETADTCPNCGRPLYIGDMIDNELTCLHCGHNYADNEV